MKITWNGVTDETDVVGQLNLLNNYIAQGVNGLVYAATDSTAMNEVSTSATKAGIKVVSIDSGTSPQPRDVLLIETNNISGAKLAAAQLAKAIGPAGGQVTPGNVDTGAVFVTRSDLNNPIVRQFVNPRCGSPRQVDVG